MSFRNMKLEELQKAAHLFQIPITETDKREDIIVKLQDAGRTYSMYKKFDQPQEQQKPGGVEFNQTILLKMARQNGSFEVYGYKFTKSHPYQVMSAEDAQKIMDTYDGFVIASPDEAKSFYA